MMTLISQFHFMRPWWLLALLPCIGMLWRLIYVKHQGLAWQAVCDSHLLPHLLLQSNKSKQSWPWYLLLISWLLAVIALAGPTWSKSISPLYQSQIARVIAIDLSPSMLATDLEPNRITRARYKILDMLKKLNEGQTGMVAFASEAYTVSPLTQDASTIAAMVPALTPNIMPVSGHNIAQALQKSADLFQQADIKHGMIYLITDNTPRPSAIKTAKKLADEGYQTSVLGVGTVEGAPIPNAYGGFESNIDGQTNISRLNNQALSSLATAGDGRYVAFTNSDKDILQLISKQQERSHIASAKSDQAHIDRWHDQGRWLIFILLPFALLAFNPAWLEDLFS